MAEMQRSRLIPVSGIKGHVEAEQRATSALLSVLTIVRPFSKLLFEDLPATNAKSATVESFIECTLESNGTKVRPDGLIRVSYGSQAPWQTLVEVKTGQNLLEADQLNSYLAAARSHSIDAVLSVSNEIQPAPGEHPTKGVSVRANSKVQLHHMSWARILATAITARDHVGVDDPEQRWILGELIRYLEHPESGALDFSDMGPHWVPVRSACEDRTLSKRTEGVDEVVTRWDQLVQYAALKLSASTGADVRQAIPKAHRVDPRKRVADQVDRLISDGILDATLRVPGTAGDMTIVADVRSERLAATVSIDAPPDKTNRGRVGWLVRQLDDAPEQTVVESRVPHARGPAAAASIAAARDSSSVLLPPDKKNIYRFEVTLRSAMGVARSTKGRRAGFVDSVLGLVNGFYEDVVQNVTPYVERAPQVVKAPTSGAPAHVGDGVSDDTSRPVTHSWLTPVHLR